MKGNLGELKFTDKHGEGLDQREPDVVKELRLLLLLHLGIGVEEDEEAKAEGDDEEGVPKEEGEEGSEDAEEHGGVDVAPGVQSEHRSEVNIDQDQCQVGCRPRMLSNSIQEMSSTYIRR